MFSLSTVRSKLAASFGALAAMVLLVAGLSVSSLSNETERFATFVDGVTARSNVAHEVRTAVDRRAIAARNLVLVTKPADLEVERDEVQKAHADVQTHLSRLTSMIEGAPDASAEAKSLVAEIARVERGYGPVALAIVELALSRKHDEAVAKMNDECRPMLAALIQAERNYSAYTQARSRELTAEAASNYATQRARLIAACVLAFASAIGAGLLITRSLNRALGEEPSFLGDAAKRISDGDLSPIAGSDVAPAGSVLSSLGTMQASLASIVGQVRGASDSIATGSTEIATGNADLSQRTEEQASALQETSATMTQLGTTVRTNADSAAQANQLALGASLVATRGGEVVSQVVDTMKDINQSSKRIADITSVIDSIAFQTNILALNAAVEAARAGEQGRGFAVVASEVRSLAQRSAAAAKEIKELITASVDRVTQGSRLVDQAGVTMVEIVSSIKRVTDIVGEISSASNEQSAGVTQVGQAVSQMDTVTQQNAALVEESAAAAESLRGQAEQLVRAVAVFKLGGCNAEPLVAQQARHSPASQRPNDACRQEPQPRTSQPVAATLANEHAWQTF